MYTDALYRIGPAATLSCPITPIGTQERANLATDAHAETVAKREVAQAELQVALSVRSLDLPTMLATSIKSLNDHVEEG